jgi:peptide/nickel transport system permease protein
VNPLLATDEAAEAVAKIRPPGRRQRKPATGVLIAGLCLIGLVLLASVVGHFVLPDPNEQDLLAPLEQPSIDHLFGTDELGRDVLSRTLAATWLDLSFGLFVTAVSVTAGVAIGSTAGYFGGRFEGIVMRITDAVVAFPFMVFILAIVAVVGPGIAGLVIALVSVGWALYARLSRAEMLVLRETQFIQAAQTLGFSSRRVVLRHAIPNLLRPIAVFSCSDVVFNILAIAGLSFLGLGVRPPTPEWGAIIASGQGYVLSAWWISALPGVVVVIVGLGFVFVGDALGERLGVTREGIVA